MISKKEQIIALLPKILSQTDIANRVNASQAYVSQLKKEYDQYKKDDYDRI